MHSHEGPHLTFIEALPYLRQGYSLVHPDLGRIATLAGDRESVFIKAYSATETDRFLQKVTVQNMDNYYVHTISNINLLIHDLSIFKGTRSWELNTPKDLI